MNKTLKEFLNKNAIFAKEESSLLMKKDLESWGIDSNSLFYKLFGAVALFPSGNTVEINSLGEVKKHDNLLLIGDDELGLLVYDIDLDMVYEYEFDAEKDYKYYLAEKRNNFIESWNSFEEFLEDYYQDEL
ncbi:MAG: hypothetical protein PHO62_07630 [Sulfurimonas sp.]|uniref:hypothetical protein n=1 Tax=Sulfurimonas sp. TaxID=2022749 RepID=UPI00260B34C7|nr:hypothetical protein [Sulfurimonas sp.]MDD5373276.1 hypothetical protein [Sulfurimonas sp.]